MGEERDIPPDMARFTVRDAADMLGITTGAVRNRLSRGTLQSIKERGTVYVLLPGDTPRDTERDTGDIPSETSALVAQLRDEISYLREENRRKDHLLAAALERIPPQLEAPPGPQNQAESAEPRSDKGTGAEEPEEATERPRRGLWRIIFGG